MDITNKSIKWGERDLFHGAKSTYFLSIFKNVFKSSLTAYSIHAVYVPVTTECEVSVFPFIQIQAWSC